MDITPHKVFFICGIDTDVGKTFATGLIARYFRERGVNVITQKIAQTGNKGPISEDIAMHRKIMGIPLTEHDLSGDTCPYVFRLPASPHFAAKKEHSEIIPDRITKATERLLQDYDIVLLEGAGGFHVPLLPDYLISDYVTDLRYPTILVTSGKLGSINHTLLTLASVESRKLEITGLVYNSYGSPPGLETFRYFRKYGTVVKMPRFDANDPADVDFTPFFNVYAAFNAEHSEF